MSRYTINVKKAFRHLAHAVASPLTRPGGDQTMKSSALSRYIDRHADKLDPAEKQLLARLPDDAVELAHAALFGNAMAPEPPDEARRRDQVRRNVPAVLSDQELDLALDVARHMECEAMAAEEYIAETFEYMTAEEYERMSQIARGVEQELK